MIEQQRQILELQRRQAEQAAGDPHGTWLQFLPVTLIHPFPSGAGGNVYYAGLPRATQTPRRFRCWAYVADKNDIANHWTITPEASDTSSITPTLSTAAIGVGIWGVIETTTMTINPLLASDHQIVQIKLGSVGVPGELLLIPMLYVV